MVALYKPIPASTVSFGEIKATSLAGQAARLFQDVLLLCLNDLSRPLPAMMHDCQKPSFWSFHLVWIQNFIAFDLNVDSFSRHNRLPNCISRLFEMSRIICEVSPYLTFYMISCFQACLVSMCGIMGAKVHELHSHAISIAQCRSFMALGAPEAIKGIAERSDARITLSGPGPFNLSIEVQRQDDLVTGPRWVALLFRHYSVSRILSSKMSQDTFCGERKLFRRLTIRLYHETVRDG